MAKKNDIKTNNMFSKFVSSLENPLASIVDEGTIYDKREFVDTGNYLYNAQLSGSIYGGILSNRIFVLAGDPSTGKTFMVLSIIKRFLEKDLNSFVFFFETEGAVDSQMLRERNIDTKRIAIIPVGSTEEFKIQITKLLKNIQDTNKDERPSFLIALDSIGMLASEKEETDALEGKTTTDMTRAKTLKSIFRIISLKLASLNIPMIATNHVYDSMSFIPMKTMGGGKGSYFGASMISFLSKAQLKESGVMTGITVTSKLEKGRITKEKTVVKMNIDFMEGLSQYSGLFDWCVEQKLIKESGKECCWIGDETNMIKTKIAKETPELFFTKEKLDNIVEPYVNSFFKFGGSSSSLECSELEDN